MPGFHWAFVLPEGFPKKSGREKHFVLTEKVLPGTRTFPFGAAGALLLACVVASAAQTGPTSGSDTSTTKTPAPHSSATASGSKSTTTTHTAASRKRPSSRRKKNVRARGQQKIDSERAQEIQEALIREHYLTGDATGKWNQACEDAMRRYQADNGWQSKTVPDSRALIKLGLGPSHDHLLNPESAMTTTPDAPHTAPATSVPHTATAPADPAPASGSSHDPPAQK